MVIYFLGVRTDTVLESSHGNMSAHKKFQLKNRSQLSIAIPSPDDGLAQAWHGRDNATSRRKCLLMSGEAKRRIFVCSRAGDLILET